MTGYQSRASYMDRNGTPRNLVRVEAMTNLRGVGTRYG